MLHSPHHHPPHIFQSSTIYFLLARTVDKQHYFDTDTKKNLLFSCIKEASKKYDTKLCSWIILDNHYQLQAQFENGRDVPKFIKIINGKSSYLLNRLESKSGRKIWYNYWDRCIRSERDFWIRFNYNHHNCVKHGYAQKMEDYKWSSYNYYLEKYGEKWLDSVFEQYPIVDFTLEVSD